jgi:hypothetical protein
VDGEQGPISSEKPVPTKTQFTMILDAARDSTLTRSSLLVAAARLYGVQPSDQRRHEAVTWARTVIDYAGAERELARMEADGLIVGKQAYQWAELGHRIGGTQAGTTYYVSARMALAIQDRNEHHVDQALWERAAAAADAQMRTQYPDRWARLRQEAYEALQKGASEGGGVS